MDRSLKEKPSDNAPLRERRFHGGRQNNHVALQDEIGAGDPASASPRNIGALLDRAPLDRSRFAGRVKIVVGVDVGGQKKGFHAVALRGGQFFEKFATRDVREVVSWCRKLDASAIGIDVPCCWSRTGQARSCERALAAEGLHAFATPSQMVHRTTHATWGLQGAQHTTCPL